MWLYEVNDADFVKKGKNLIHHTSRNDALFKNGVEKLTALTLGMKKRSSRNIPE